MDEQENEMPFTVSDTVTGQEVTFGPGVAGTISARENVNISKGGGVIIAAGKDVSLVDGGALAIPVGHDLTLVNGGAMIMPVGGSVDLVNGGAQIMTIGGNLNMANGGGGIVMASQATLNNSFCGVVLSGQTKLDGDSRVLLDTKRAVAFGAALGGVFALLSWLLRKK